MERFPRDVWIGMNTFTRYSGRGVLRVSRRKFATTGAERAYGPKKATYQGIKCKKLGTQIGMILAPKPVLYAQTVFGMVAMLSAGFARSQCPIPDFKAKSCTAAVEWPTRESV